MVSLIFADFETYYSKEYSANKMTTIEYVLDRRFECLGVGAQHGRAGKPYWVPAQEIPAWVQRVRDLPDVVMVSHNALFDMLILAWRYGYVPPRMIDTLGMSRALLGHRLKSLSLASVSQHLGFGDKGATLKKTIGVNLRELTSRPALYREMQDYCCDDVNKCARIFSALVGQFPASEVPVMDMVLRACVVPQFKLNRVVLDQHMIRVLSDKRKALELASVVDAGDLRSADKFAGLLRQLGIEPPMKTSLTTGKQTYAFAKTDSAFIDLAEDDDPKVQALVAARLGQKSTLEETRTQRLINIGNLTWPVGKDWMPIPLGYGRAHTHRLGGEMKINMQNLPRGGALRRALVAPKGYLVVSVDLSQIEARIVAWLCEQHDLLEAFGAGEDVYASFASEVFGVEVNKKVNPDYRFIGKTSILGLGYNMSWRKFLLTLKSSSRKELGRVVELDDDMGQMIVNTYRRKYGRISFTWNMLGTVGITTLARDGTMVFGPCVFSKEQILLPNGMKLNYYDLRFHAQSDIRGAYDQWIYTYGRLNKLLFGGKVLENVTQALARIVVMDLAMRAIPEVGRFAHQVHDELIYVVKAKQADHVAGTLIELAKIRPTWAPELPLAAEAKIGPSYGEMKA